MADEVKVDKKSLHPHIGRRLAARVLRSWTEDFVDEDTGEVVTIERNEIVLDRDSILNEENAAMIQEMGIKTVAEYLESLRKMKPRACGLGEQIENPVDHPMIRPSINAVAETYRLAEEPAYRDLIVTTSPISGKEINRFTHISMSPDDLVKRVKINRTL